jgi:hypothetical protein
VTIGFNGSPSRLEGLAGLPSVGALEISGESALVDLDGLQGLTAIDGPPRLRARARPRSVDGLRSLTSLDVSAEIEDNSSLPSCGAEGFVRRLSDGGWRGIVSIAGNDSAATCEARHG